MTPEQASESSAQVIEDIEDIRTHLTALDDRIANHTEQLRIDLKTYVQWDSEYDVKVPRDALPHDIKGACNRLIELRTIATANLSKAKMERREFLYKYDNDFNAQVEAECGRRGNRNGIDKIKEQVRSVLGDFTLFKSRLEHRIEFWQDKISYCNDVYKALNTMAMCNGTAAKLGETF